MRVESGTYSFEIAEPWALNIEGPNPEVAGVGAGWVPITCHALQVFHRA